ncbi:hypothetical protein, partial [Photobacterium phosphoreum]
MNLFNVSLAQTAKPTAAATSGGESETVSLSDNDFSQQYQQAIDDSAINAEMIGTDSEINTYHRGMTDISTSTDIPVSDSIA